MQINSLLIYAIIIFFNCNFVATFLLLLVLERCNPVITILSFYTAQYRNASMVYTSWITLTRLEFIPLSDQSHVFFFRISPEIDNSVLAADTLNELI